MFDRPSLALAIAFATFPNLAAFALVHLAGVDGLGVLCVLFVGFGSWYVMIIYCAAELEEYKRVNSTKPALPAVASVRPRLLEMNTGKPLYAFQTPVVKIDHMSRKIKHMCIVLVNQRDNGFKIDLREQTWNAHFGGRDNFVQARDVRLSGAFAKESGRVNSPFAVIDWRIVEEAAKGHLPH